MKADGSVVQAADINPGGDSRPLHPVGNSQPEDFIVFNGELYFRAFEDTAGNELWKVKADGSVVQVADILAGALSSNPDYFALGIAPGDHEPVVANPIADQTLPEDTAWTFTVPANTFSDVGGDALAYTVSLADDSVLPGWLSFNAVTRTVSGTPPANFNGQIALKVTASDGSLTASDTFVLNITAVNDAPIVTSNSGGNTASVSNAENTTAVTVVTATDPDAGQALSYSISGSADANKFTINSNTGALSFITAPNFRSADRPGRQQCLRRDRSDFRRRWWRGHSGYRG